MKKRKLIAVCCIVLGALCLFSACDKEEAGGESVYEIAVRNGYTGTEEEYLASLVGKDGEKGEAGKDGVDGKDGVGIAALKIEDGELWVRYDGAEEDVKVGEIPLEVCFRIEKDVLQWKKGENWIDILELTSLQGEKGDAGRDGKDGADGKSTKWYALPGKPSAVEDAESGDLYLDIDSGDAYSFDGSVWIKICSLHGEKGKDGQDGKDGRDGKDGMNGTDGQDGKDGMNGTQWFSGKGTPSGITASKGDYYLNVDTCDVYTFDGTKWNILLNIQGKEGKQGEAGTVQKTEHTVSFDAGEGTVNVAKVSVEHGEYLTLPIPVREGYTFEGWYTGEGVNDGKFTSYSAVCADLTLTARYSRAAYTLTYYVDGVKYKEATYAFGETVAAEGTPTGEGTFGGWENLPAVMPARDVNVYGSFDNRITVLFVDWDGKEIKTDRIEKGADATPPAHPIRSGYDFNGWDTEFTKLNESVTVRATYLKKVTVRFEDYDGSLLKEDTVHEGENATPPSNPQRTGYSFLSWNKSYQKVTADCTITATYEILHFQVSFTDDEGKVLQTFDSVAYGSTVEPNTPEKEGYTFVRWDTDFSSVVSDLTVKAVFEQNQICVHSQNGYVIADGYLYKYCSKCQKGYEKVIVSDKWKDDTVSQILSDFPYELTLVDPTIGGSTLEEFDLNGDGEIEIEILCGGYAGKLTVRYLSE